MKIWNSISINDNREELIAIPRYFKFIDPHPYFDLGAPYEDQKNIWKLRVGVVNRLIEANNYLKSKNSGFSLLIYDSWRPLKVQKFMFNREFILECERLNLDVSVNDMQYYPLIKKKIEKFWAFPSLNDNCPPPHSTGGALDVCLSDESGNLIEMGSAIDQMDATSEPEYYKNINKEDAIIWNDRRNLLKEVMLKFEFVQHPNEWWHFSYGDQLWAWKKKKASAFYGII